MSLIVVETSHKNFVTTMDDDAVNVYTVTLEDEAKNEADFEDALLIDRDMSAWNFEEVGTVTIPIYKATRK